MQYDVRFAVVVCEAAVTPCSIGTNMFAGLIYLKTDLRSEMPDLANFNVNTAGSS